MSALERFDFGTHGVRVVVIDGDPWFVASDVAAALEYDRTSNMTRLLDEDERGTHIVSTPGGMQEVTVVSEPGLHSAVMRSRSDRAREFRRWITHDVIPSILRTGAYAVPETPELLMARAVLQAQELLERRDIQIRELTPRAEAWDEIASADGDYSVADAAKMLARAGVTTGPQRLFAQLEALNWIFRGSDGKWRAYAGRVDSGHLAERPQSHHHPATGDLVIDPPQVRVTLKGIERLRVRLGVLTAVEVAS
jgi:prophage antirepressor-like protein